MVVIENYFPSVYATCVTNPSGATLCVGQASAPVNNTKVKPQGYPSDIKGKPDVNITLGCGPRDINYGSYSNTCYEPTVLVVNLGTKVTWRNDDTLVHSVTYGNPWLMHSIGYFFDSGTLVPGQTFTHQFNYLGAYPYFDTFNIWETGLVIVKN